MRASGGSALQVRALRISCGRAAGYPAGIAEETAICAVLCAADLWLADRLRPIRASVILSIIKTMVS